MPNYYIDLACLEVEGDDEDDAYKKALDMIKSGKVTIEITNVEKV